MFTNKKEKKKSLVNTVEQGFQFRGKKKGDNVLKKLLKIY